MLHELGLAYVVQDDVLLITTTEAEEQKLVTRVYPVADLVERYRDEKGTVWTDSKPLTDKIQSTVQPKTWAEKGGPGSMCAYREDATERLPDFPDAASPGGGRRPAGETAQGEIGRRPQAAAEPRAIAAKTPAAARRRWCARVGFSPAGAAACSAATRCPSRLSSSTARAMCWAGGWPCVPA